VNKNLRSLLLGFLVYGVEGTLSAALPAYPLKVPPGGRYVVDQHNQPFLIIADAPHNLFTMFTSAEANTYLRNRATNGFNTLWVEALTGEYTWAHTDGANSDGDRPFTNTLVSGLYDLTSPKVAYWSHASNIVFMCATNGLQVFLDSIETGNYIDTAVANGTNRCYQYGQFLGRYFRNFTNIMWITGNDYHTYNREPNDSCIRNIAMGITNTDTNHIHTLQADTGIPCDYALPAWRDIISINGVYSYYSIAYDYTLQAWNTNTMPVLFLEGPYEGKTWSTSTGGTANNLRRTEYWSLLSGSLVGFMYGNYYTDVPLAGWETNLNTIGTTQLSYFSNLFGTRAWFTLVPDQAHKLVVSGYGTKLSGNVFNENSDYATAAFNTNGTLGVVYTPVSRTLTVAMTNFSGAVTSRWFDPTANTFTAIDGSPFPNTITTNLTTPGDNAGGDGDWVLLLEAPPRPLIRSQIMQATFNGSNFVVSFSTVSGQNYELQKTAALGSGSWLSVAANIPGTGGLHQVTDTNALGQAQAFYCVKTGM